MSFFGRLSAITAQLKDQVCNYLSEEGQEILEVSFDVDLKSDEVKLFYTISLVGNMGKLAKLFSLADEGILEICDTDNYLVFGVSEEFLDIAHGYDGWSGEVTKETKWHIDKAYCSVEFELYK